MNGYTLSGDTRLDTRSPDQEVAHDLLAIVDMLSARLDGLRAYQKVIRDAALHQDSTPGQ